jgi:hypothetical protein
MEPKCDEPKCRYCADRPDRPLIVKEVVEKRSKKKVEAKKEDE